MPYARQEREELAKADRDIVEGEQRLSEQIARIERLTEHGHDVTQARKLLQRYEQAPEEWHRHRQIILYEIAREEGHDPHDTPVP